MSGPPEFSSNITFGAVSWLISDVIDDPANELAAEFRLVYAYDDNRHYSDSNQDLLAFTDAPCGFLGLSGRARSREAGFGPGERLRRQRRVLPGRKWRKLVRN